MHHCSPVGRRFCIFLVPVILIFGSCSKKAVPETPPPVPAKPLVIVSTANMEVDILKYVNLHRKSAGRGPVQLNSVESSVALQHSRNMAEGRTPFGHKGLDLRMNTISRQIGPVNSIGENVAMGQMTAKEVVESWLQSPPHRKNIEGDFILTGIGWAKDPHGTIYYTQIFTR